MSNEGSIEWAYEPFHRLFRIMMFKDGEVLGDLATPQEGVRQLIEILQEALRYAEECDKALAGMPNNNFGDAIGPALWQAPPVNIVVPPGEEPV